MNHMLRKHGIPAAQALAWGERRTGAVWTKSLLVLQAVIPGTTLREYLEQNAAGGAVSDLIDRLAVCVARLHDEGFYYRDLHGNNVLLGVEDVDRPTIHFVDLHEVRYVGTTGRHMCIDDLARLNGYLSTAARNRVRFLKRYLAERGIGADEWKRWAQDTDSRSRAMWDRNYRKRGKWIDKY